MVSGEVILDGPLKIDELPKQLLIESNNKLWDRYLEIHQVVSFLVEKNRLLTIYGEHKLGRKAITRHSIKTVMK